MFSTPVISHDAAFIIGSVLTLACYRSWLLPGFALFRQVTIHTFGLVQSKLFPVYFYCLVVSNVLSLAVYAVYHPRELLDWHESMQVSADTTRQYLHHEDDQAGSCLPSSLLLV